MAALGREMNSEFVVAMIPVSEHAAAFERDRGLPVHAELTAQTDRRRSERDGVAFVYRAGAEGVVRPIVEHAGAARPHRRDGIDHGGKRVEFELDKIGEI